ncbi:uncharacterized protein LOC129126097 isoform X2 [Agelaius phoeniceus]|uniref:uncharacterized protein LOC129126097 isoform X2 n=1 Tax=Agelaius phoeniceus TaxID=39638 RepID=UPI004054CB24
MQSREQIAASKGNMFSSKKTHKQTKTPREEGPFKVARKCFIFRHEGTKTNLLSLRISHDQFISDSPDHTLGTTAGAQTERPAVESAGLYRALEPILP